MTRPELLLFVVQDSARWIELLEKIEINNVTGQHHTSTLPRACEEQGIVQNGAPVVPPVALQSG